MQSARHAEMHVVRPGSEARTGDTTQPEPGANPVARLYAEIDALAPQITVGAAAAEAARRVPADIMTRLGAAGLFRLSVPKSHGGLEVDFPTTLDIVRRLSRLDGSLGWLAGVRGATPVFLTLLPRERYDALLADGPDVLLSGVSQPAGRAEAVPGGWRVSGSWPFASGCHESALFAVNSVLMRDGKPVPGPMEGVPAMRFLTVPARQVRIEDTWHAIGLKATASHNIVVENAFVPDSDGVDLGTAKPCVSGPLYGAPMQLIPLLHGPVAVGVAEGALDDVIALAQSGRRQFGAPSALAESEIFHYELGQAHADLRAARALLEAAAAEAWQGALAGTLTGAMPNPRLTEASVWVTETCLRVVQACYRLGGGSALYEASPLQRRLRDIEAAAQHAGAQRRNYGPIGKALLAADPEAPAKAA